MSETASSTRVLHIEDDPGIARLVEKRLKRLRYEVSTACDGESGLEKLQDAHFDIIVMDLQMPGMDGLQVLKRLKNLAPHPPVIMLTGTGNEKAAVQALKLGAADYIVKDVGGGYLD
ncbi:MAG: response regulator, partial [Chloroflexi bacterium]